MVVYSHACSKEAIFYHKRNRIAVTWFALTTHSNSGYNILSTQTYTNNPVTIICWNNRRVARLLWICQGQQFFGLVVGAHQGLRTPLGILLSLKTLLVLQFDACTGNAECHSGCGGTLTQKLWSVAPNRDSGAAGERVGVNAACQMAPLIDVSASANANVHTPPYQIIGGCNSRSQVVRSVTSGRN
jgi:hypothetical protein